MLRTNNEKVSRSKGGRFTPQEILRKHSAVAVCGACGRPKHEPHCALFGRPRGAATWATAVAVGAAVQGAILRAGLSGGAGPFGFGGEREKPAT